MDENNSNFERMQTQTDNNDKVQKALKNQANQIVSKINEDYSLLNDTFESVELRRDIIRNMPQCLTVKHGVKNMLEKSIIEKSISQHPISSLKRLEYQRILKYSQMNFFKIYNFGFEFWQDTLKNIEGSFGSGIATYFKFLRWLFIVNSLITLIILFLIIIPEIIIHGLVGNLKDFRITDLLTGKGFLENSLLYYGFYSNKSVNFFGISYYIPYAYFLTMVMVYIAFLVILCYRVAISYRRNLINKEEGWKNQFANVIFSGWDYSIATKEGANWHSLTIYNEINELYNELHIESEKISLLQQIQIYVTRFFTNFLIILITFSIGFCLSWSLSYLQTQNNIFYPISIAIVVNSLNFVFPLIFEEIARLEYYKNPKFVQEVTLIRSYLFGFVIVGTLVSFWLKKSFDNRDCWETSLGQEVYILILFDFLLTLLMYGLSSINYKFKTRKSKYEFDVANNIHQIIYNQSLFLMGLFVSPLLSLIMSIKIILVCYIKECYLLKLCKPSTIVWKANETKNWFLTLLFISFLTISCLMLFIFLSIPSSACGPFKDYVYVKDIVFNHENLNFPFIYLNYLTEPGVVVLIILALSVRIYYVREILRTQVIMVKTLRQMRELTSKDKDFLLQSISEITKGAWKYNAKISRKEDPYIIAANIE